MEPPAAKLHPHYRKFPPLFCPDWDCGGELLLHKSPLGLFYRCSRYPACRATHQAHPDGKPVGSPADLSTRKLRFALHKLCQQIWNYEMLVERRRMYAWLEENSLSHHIGRMEREEILEVKAKLEAMLLDS